MNLKELYPAIETAYHAMAHLYEPAIQTAAGVTGLTSTEISILLSVPTFEPNPVSSEILNIRSPYTASEYYDAVLSSLQKKGMLETAGPGKYHMTRPGLETIKIVLHAAYAAMAGVRSLKVTEMMDLASRLKDYSDACYTAPEPPGKWCILHTRRLDPGTGAEVMVRIDQFLSELRAYRDDAHLAAWKGYEKNGHAWDILTLLWTEDKLSTTAINEKLSRKGNSLEQTQTAVDQLLKKGWVTATQEIVQITPFGADIRKIAEETTDRYYFAPFRKFDDVDLESTLVLINKHRRGIPRP